MNTLLPPRVRPTVAAARGRHVALVLASGIGFDLGLRAGLGLSIARWIVDLHGGDIRARTNTPSGCSMVCRLPRH